MFEKITKCADREKLFQNLTVKALQDIETVLEAYDNDEIDFVEPRDEYGNPDTGDYELVIKKAGYEEIGIELLVMKWIENHESTDYLIACMTDSIYYPATCGLVNGKATYINMSEAKALVKVFNKNFLGVPPMKTEEGDEYICPNCFDTIGYLNDEIEDADRGCFCSWCGQKIDWNNALSRSSTLNRKEAFRRHLNLSEKSFSWLLEALEDNYQKNHNNI